MLSIELLGNCKNKKFFLLFLCVLLFLLQNHVYAYDAPKSEITNTDGADAGSDFEQQEPAPTSSEDVKKQKRYSLNHYKDYLNILLTQRPNLRPFSPLSPFPYKHAFISKRSESQQEDQIAPPRLYKRRPSKRFLPWPGMVLPTFKAQWNVPRKRFLPWPSMVLPNTNPDSNNKHFSTEIEGENPDSNNKHFSTEIEGETKASGRKKYFQPMEWTRSIKSLEGIPDEEYYNKYPSSTNRITKRSYPSTGQMTKSLQKRPLWPYAAAMDLMPKKRYVFGTLPHQFETHNHLPNSTMERFSDMLKPPYLRQDNDVANNDDRSTVANPVVVRSLEDQGKTLGISGERPPYSYQRDDIIGSEDKEKCPCTKNGKVEGIQHNKMMDDEVDSRVNIQYI